MEWMDISSPHVTSYHTGGSNSKKWLHWGFDSSPGCNLVYLTKGGLKLVVVQSIYFIYIEDWCPI